MGDDVGMNPWLTRGCALQGALYGDDGYGGDELLGGAGWTRPSCKGPRSVSRGLGRAVFLARRRRCGERFALFISSL